MPGKGVPGLVMVGDSFSGKVKGFGIPDKRQVVQGRVFCFYQKHGVMIVSDTAGDKVWMVQLFSPDFATSGGLRVGATRAQVEKSLGKKYTLYDKGANTAYQLIYPEGIAFAFNDEDTVMSINVMKPI